jgi:hypothetical protein
MHGPCVAQQPRSDAGNVWLELKNKQITRVQVIVDFVKTRVLDRSRRAIDH